MMKKRFLVFSCAVFLCLYIIPGGVWAAEADLECTSAAEGTGVPESDATPKDAAEVQSMMDSLPSEEEVRTMWADYREQALPWQQTAIIWIPAMGRG